MNNLKQLHDRDFNLWIQEMAIAIKSQDINALLFTLPGYSEAVIGYRL